MNILGFNAINALTLSMSRLLHRNSMEYALVHTILLTHKWIGPEIMPKKNSERVSLLVWLAASRLASLRIHTYVRTVCFASLFYDCCIILGSYSAQSVLGYDSCCSPHIHIHIVHTHTRCSVHARGKGNSQGAGVCVPYTPAFVQLDETNRPIRHRYLPSAVRLYVALPSLLTHGHMVGVYVSGTQQERLSNGHE